MLSLDLDSEKNDFLFIFQNSVFPQVFKVLEKSLIYWFFNIKFQSFNFLDNLITVTCYLSMCHEQANQCFKQTKTIKTII